MNSRYANRLHGSPRDPEKLLAEYRKTLGEVAEVRDRLKAELMAALGPHPQPLSGKRRGE